MSSTIPLQDLNDDNQLPIAPSQAESVVTTLEPEPTTTPPQPEPIEAPSQSEPTAAPSHLESAVTPLQLGSTVTLPTEQSDLQTPLLSNPKETAPKVEKRGVLSAFLKNIGASIVNFGRHALRGDITEEKKVVIDQSCKLALIRCSIHFLPICASITLASLNLKGYFIGAQFQGLSGDVVDAVDTLALQITAKLMELLMVASLGSIILDVIRHEILVGPEGLPFGLLGAASAFKDFSYFWSPSFWYSSKAITSRRRKWMLLGILVVSGLIATFAGPSSALLMIPVVRSSWPGGGTTFWLVGDKDSLWPPTLNATSVGGTFCLNPTAEMLDQAILNTSGCIWYSTSNIGQALQAWHLNDGIRNLTIVDGSYERSVGYLASTNDYYDTWALSTNAAVGIWSNQLANGWEGAIFNAPIAQSIGPYYGIKYRERESTIARIQTPLPVVRSKCNYYGPAYFNNTGDLEFPVLPEYGYEAAWSYWIPASFANSSDILTQWIPIPEGTTDTNNGSVLDYYPSAFLTVQIPYLDSISSGSIHACSVDARWALGDNVAMHVRDASTENFIQHGEIMSTVSTLPARGFAPIDDGTWSKVAIDLDWLYTLTPLLRNASLPQSRTEPGWTSLASILVRAGFDNSTGLVSFWGDLRSSIEGAVAILVVEGMARIGLSGNGGRINHFTDVDNLINYLPNMNDAWNALLMDGVAVLPPGDIDSANLTQLHWGLTVSGYSYLADSAAYYLALVVLFSYIAVAVAHIAYRLYTRRSSEAWHSFEEILALSQNSPPAPQALKNTSAGIRRNATLRRRVKIRAVTDENHVHGGEELQLLFDLGAEDGYEMVAVNTAYGAAD